MELITPAVSTIRARRQELPPGRSLLVGVTGIDASGKGYLTDRVVVRLREEGVRAVGIGADGWLNLPGRRFDPDNPAEHFYEHAIRFEEMFAELVLPLRDNRSVHLVADLTEETAAGYHRHTYHFEDVEVIILEGIFLLKRAHRAYFDVSFWVDCTFETALERALRRGQEGLPAEETARRYHTIYFPAQRIHLARDDPRSAATAVVNNDPRIPPPV